MQTTLVTLSEAKGLLEQFLKQLLGSCYALGVAEGLCSGGEPAAVDALMAQMLHLWVAHVARVVGFGAAVLAEIGLDRLEGPAEVAGLAGERAAGGAELAFGVFGGHGILRVGPNGRRHRRDAALSSCMQERSIRAWGRAFLLGGRLR